MDPQNRIHKKKTLVKSLHHGVCDLSFLTVNTRTCLMAKFRVERLANSVSSKQTKKKFSWNRNKPKQDLFRLCFGLFGETKNKNVWFVPAF